MRGLYEVTIDRSEAGSVLVNDERGPLGSGRSLLPSFSTFCFCWRRRPLRSCPGNTVKLVGELGWQLGMLLRFVRHGLLILLLSWVDYGRGDLQLMSGDGLIVGRVSFATEGCWQCCCAASTYFFSPRLRCAPRRILA